MTEKKITHHVRVVRMSYPRVVNTLCGKKVSKDEATDADDPPGVITCQTCRVILDRVDHLGVKLEHEHRMRTN